MTETIAAAADRPNDAPEAEVLKGECTAAMLREAVLEKLTYSVGKDRNAASERDWFVATALAVRDRIVDNWMASARGNYRDNRRRVYYLSLEFLIGRLLVDSLTNLGIVEPMRAALASLDVDLDKLRDVEPDAAWAMAASAVSPPASWKAWRRSPSPPMATASATTTACSARPSSTAGSTSFPRTGWSSATPGSSRARRSAT